jgi:hypothetical protein
MTKSNYTSNVENVTVEHSEKFHKEFKKFLRENLSGHDYEKQLKNCLDHIEFSPSVSKYTLISKLGTEETFNFKCITEYIECEDRHESKFLALVEV